MEQKIKEENIKDNLVFFFVSIVEKYLQSESIFRNPSHGIKTHLCSISVS